MDKFIKFFGENCNSKQEFIEKIYEAEVSIVYRGDEYDICLDGRGYYIGMTTCGCRSTTQEEYDKSEKVYVTPEELVNNHTFYDGVKLSDAMEMNYYDLLEKK